MTNLKGFLCKLDEQGRLKLPMELRKEMGIAEKGLVQIVFDGEKIVMKKFEA